MKFLTTAYKNCVDFALIYDGEKQRKGCRAVVMVFEGSLHRQIFFASKATFKNAQMRDRKDEFFTVA